jgi:asparagine synthase (glutamine-hydrolysing)
MADVPVGIFLSSGLDSATLLALTREIHPSASLRTITLGFKELQGTPADEVPLAERLAARFKTDHSSKLIQESDFEKALPKILQVMDQPSIDGVNTFFVSQAAAEQGLKVALSGVGGDEIFGSYPSFRQIPRMVAAAAPFSRAPFLGVWARRLAAPLIPSGVSPKYAGLLEYAGTYGGAYLLRRGIVMPWELDRFLDPEIVRQGLAELQLPKQMDRQTEAVEGAHWKVSELEFKWYLRNQLLRDADWAGMAHSLEIRVPFVDPIFLRNCYALIRSGRVSGKKEMASATVGALPPDVAARQKSGFSTPVYHWTSGGANPHRGIRQWARKVFEAVAS